MYSNDKMNNFCATSNLLGTPETSFSGRSTRNVRNVFKLIASSEPAGITNGKNLKNEIKYKRAKNE